MCGIAGFLFRPDKHSESVADTLQRMTTALAARGPDGEGHWIDMAAGVALGHRRLSIVDLSLTGRQPMVSSSGRYMLIFNGEIYNHHEIRQSLASARLDTSSKLNGNLQFSEERWKGTSDTESLLTAIDAWGVNEALRRCVGMFAFALWDSVDRTLTLARDRLGEKPLYCGWVNGTFAFASELKAFRAIPGFSPSIDEIALWHYFCQRAIPAPYSIYQGIQKLEPGQVLTIHTERDLPQSRVVKEYYWSLNRVLQKDPFCGTPNEAVEELSRLLSQAVAMQMVADVPVGAFLSGGIDSSIVVALMQSLSGSTVQTYTMGFEERAFNEAPHAAAVAKCLGTRHTELTVTTAEALAIVPRIAEIWDEPFADSSQIPTAILAALARRDVTVALSGDGGDELFCGYERHLSAAAIERIPGKPLLGALLFAFNSPTTQMRLRSLPLGQAPKAVANRLCILSDILDHADPTQRYMAFSYGAFFPNRMLGGSVEHDISLISPRTIKAPDILSLVSAVDAVTYLPTDILTKVDRAAMAVSLETRVPLLDHRIVEFAFSIPSSYKVRDGQTKWPLRQILKSYVPDSIFNRPKMGFGVPLREWMKGPLRSWAADLLLIGSSQDDLLNREMIEKMWCDQQSGAWDYSDHLWRVLMFRAWQMHHG